MLSIGEFARYGGVSVRMLRHYDALGILTPARVDPSSGYRSYAAAQMARLNRLVALKELGFGLQELGPLLDEQVSAEQMRGMLRLRRSQITDRIEADAARLREIEARLRLMESEDAMGELEFTRKPLPAVLLAQLTQTVQDTSEIGPALGVIFGRVAKALARAEVPMREPAVAWYASADKDDAMLVGAGFPTSARVVADGIAVEELHAVPHAVTLIHHGSMETIGASWQALHRYLEQEGLDPVGRCREVYLETPMDSPGTWVTELQQPVA